MDIHEHPHERLLSDLTLESLDLDDGGLAEEETEFMKQFEDDLESSTKAKISEVAPETENTYNRLLNKFRTYCQSDAIIRVLIGPNSDPFADPLHRLSPCFIIGWISSECGDGTPSEAVECTYSHAMKMRAAATYGYGRCLSRGVDRWTQRGDGAWHGNPSCSLIVSRYMVSLRRRKQSGGEIPQSSRALTSLDIKKMFQFANSKPQNTVYPIQPSARDAVVGGMLGRLLVHAVVTIAFVNLMRIDEVLSLRERDLEALSDSCVKITLPSRKTAQFGDVPPFVLYKFEEDEAYLCPLRALAKWIFHANPMLGQGEGYLFRKVYADGRVSVADKPIGQADFLEMFRNCLVDVGIDSRLYGGHSCRRGGTQWLARERGWSIARICDWGGWSKDYNHLTIVKYLFSRVDGNNEAREDFFNPAKTVTIYCPRCNRNCRCAL